MERTGGLSKAGRKSGRLGAPVLIRAMQEDDIAAVSGVLCECYLWLGKREKYTPEQIEFLVSKRGSVECVSRESREQHYFVACIEREVVGIVSIQRNVITKLYVTPACQRKQIGTQLFATAEAAIRSAGYECLTLGAFPIAVEFYRAMGLVVTGQKPCGPSPLAGLSVTLMQKCLVKGT
jgi:ribosomal protein S18 acetylase RimI-like enzyme